MARACKTLIKEMKEGLFAEIESLLGELSEKTVLEPCKIDYFETESFKTESLKNVNKQELQSALEKVMTSLTENADSMKDRFGGYCKEFLKGTGEMK